MSERDSYAEAASAARDVLRRAASLALTVRQHRVLEAVISLTALYSKIEDWIYLGQLSDLAFGAGRRADERAGRTWQEKRTAEALRALADLRLIEVEPPRRGRPGRSSGPGYRIALTRPRALGNDPDSGGISTEINDPDPGVENDPDPGVENDPDVRGPSEKGSEKFSEEGRLDVVARALAVISPKAPFPAEAVAEITAAAPAWPDGAIAAAEEAVATGELVVLRCSDLARFVRTWRTVEPQSLATCADLTPELDPDHLDCHHGWTENADGAMSPCPICPQGQALSGARA